MSPEDWPGGSIEGIRLDLDASALLIVDMQKGYTNRGNVRGEWMRVNHPGAHDYFFDRLDLVLANLVALVGRYREEALPVFHVTFGSERRDRRDMMLVAHRRRPAWARSLDDLEPFRVGGSEHQIVDELTPHPGEFVFNKTGHSAFTSTPIDLVLRSIGARQLVVGGWSTDACVGLTARDGADRGFEVFLVEDACAAFTPQSHTAFMDNFSRLYGGVITTGHILN
jgi:nicotinamidase-related amidase